MLEPGQDLTLAAEAGQNKIGVEAPFDQLHRDLLLEVVHAHGTIHTPHAAASDLLHELVVTYALTGPGNRVARPRDAVSRGRFHEIARVFIRRDQRLHLAAQRRLAFAGSIEVGGPS